MSAGEWVVICFLVVPIGLIFWGAAIAILKHIWEEWK